MPPDQRPPTARALSLLSSGRIEVQGRMPWSSNGTYLVTVTDEEGTTGAVYKPGRAERPLWDFPDGLYRREVAAYELAEALGWRLVPETVARRDGPLDAGVVLQLFVDADFSQHYFTLLEDGAAPPGAQAHATAAFDVIANNADPQGGGHSPRSTPTARCGASTTACASTPSRSCARSSGTSPGNRWPTEDRARSRRAARRRRPAHVGPAPAPAARKR